jgi:hypothetical protein
MRNFPFLKMPRIRTEWGNIETNESSKAPWQPIGWNPGVGQWKMITENSRLKYLNQIQTTEKRKSSKDQTVIEKSVEELESIQTDDELKNVLVTIINLVINSGDAKAMVGHLSKTVELHGQHHKN